MSEDEALNTAVSTMSLAQKYERRKKVNMNAKKRKGPKIKSLDRLVFLAMQRKSVYYDGPWGLLPACVVMNMQARIVNKAINSGNLYEYIPLDDRKGAKNDNR